MHCKPSIHCCVFMLQLPFLSPTSCSSWAEDFRMRALVVSPKDMPSGQGARVTAPGRKGNEIALIRSPRWTRALTASSSGQLSKWSPTEKGEEKEPRRCEGICKAALLQELLDETNHMGLIQTGFRPGSGTEATLVALRDFQVWSSGFFLLLFGFWYHRDWIISMGWT